MVCKQGRPETLTVVLLKIQVFWHIIKCHGQLVVNTLKDDSVFIFR